jgi:hypothetical protein
MVSYVHSIGGTAMLNFGWTPNPAFMEFTDIASVFEGTYDQYVAHDQPAWMDTYPADRFLNIVHSVPTAKWGDALRLSKTRNAGYVWLTDDAVVSYYKSLPGFWNDLNLKTKRTC